MASIYRRGPYQWQVLIRRKGYPTQARVFETKAEAEDWAKTTESEMVRGVFVSRKEAENTTLEEALTRYQKEISENKKGAYQESRRIENFKNHKIGKRFLATIQGKTIAEFRDERLGEVSEATVRRELVILSNLFEIVRKEWGMGGIQNPVRSINLPSGRGNERERRLTETEEKALLEGCKEYGGEIHSIVVFAIETAMRRSEIANMVWNNVDLKEMVVRRVGGKNNSFRTVPLSDLAVGMLKSMPRQLSGKIWAMEDQSITHAFVRVRDRLREAYEKEREEKRTEPDPAYLVDLTFHDLRHEATSRLAKIYQVHELAKVTGHKDLRMLMRYYNPTGKELALKMRKDSVLKAEDLAE